MALQTYTTFNTAQETTDGRGWTLTYWDDATPSIQTTELFYRLRNDSTILASVTNKALTSNVVTLTTAAAHGFVTGQQVTVNIGDTIFDGTYTMASASGSSLTYARTHANVSSAAATGTADVPRLAYTTSTLSNKALTTNVVTLTTAGPHNFYVGDWVVVASGDTIFDGTFIVATVPSTTTFTYALTHADVGSAVATGTVTTSKSLDGRMRELWSADATVISYFTAKANAVVLAANSSTVAADLAAYLAGEGLDTP